MVLHWVVKGFDIFSVNRIKVVPFQSSSCWEDREERTHRLHCLDNKSGNGNEGVVLWRHSANERNEQLNQLCSYVHIIMTSFFTHSHSKKVHVAGRTDGLADGQTTQILLCTFFRKYLKSFIEIFVVQRTDVSQSTTKMAIILLLWLKLWAIKIYLF